MSRARTRDYKFTTATGRRSPLGLFVRRLGFSLLSLAFVTGGLFFGYVFVVNLRTFLGPGGGPSVAVGGGAAGLARLIPGLQPAATATGDRASASSPDWRNQERVNILLLGVDERQGEAGQPTRTDTMMILTIDPYSKSAGILSLERDLWVPIPLDERNPIENKLNTAHFYGDLWEYPGGGLALAKKTVQYNFGVPIHYYARIDFEGFRRLIDALGGIDVDVPATLHDDEYPADDGKGGTITVHFPEGRQHLNGQKALQYARTRNPDSDFGRMQRQRQVLLAVRDQAFKLNVFPRLPQLAIEYRDIVKTDMSVTDMLSLAAIVRDIAPDRIVSRAIEPPACYGAQGPGGADIQVPVRTEIEKLISELFFDSRLREESARIEVLNGAGVDGLATRAGGMLERRGFGVVSVDNADSSKEYSGVSIVDYTGKRYTVQRLAEFFGVPPQRIESRPDPTSRVDVHVILGKGTELP